MTETASSSTNDHVVCKEWTSRAIEWEKFLTESSKKQDELQVKKELNTVAGRLLHVDPLKWLTYKSNQKISLSQLLYFPAVIWLDLAVGHFKRLYFLLQGGT